MGISKRSFGVTKDGKETFLYTITNEKGMEAAVTNFGAILVQLMVPDAKGGKRDVVLGFDSVTGYEGNDCFLVLSLAEMQTGSVVPPLIWMVLPIIWQPMKMEIISTQNLIRDSIK